MDGIGIAAQKSAESGKTHLTSTESDAIIVKRSKDARVVELADSLDSGSSAHSGRAGSSPASRTIEEDSKTSVFGSFLHFFGSFAFG